MDTRLFMMRIRCKVDATRTAQLVFVATWVLIVGFLNVLSCTGIKMNKAMISEK